MKPVLALVACLVLAPSAYAEATRPSNGITCSSTGEEGQGVQELRVEKAANGTYTFTYQPEGGQARKQAGLSCIFVDPKELRTPDGEPVTWSNPETGAPMSVTLPMMRCQAGDFVIRGTLVPVIYAIPFGPKVAPAGPRYELIVINNPFNRAAKKPYYRFETEPSPGFECREL
jgi:hypothetical protein